MAITRRPRASTNAGIEQAAPDILRQTAMRGAGNAAAISGDMLALGCLVSDSRASSRPELGRKFLCEIAVVAEAPAMIDGPVRANVKGAQTDQTG